MVLCFGRKMKKDYCSRRAFIKYSFKFRCRKYKKELNKAEMKIIGYKLKYRAIALLRLYDLLWRKKRYTKRLIALTPDHTNYDIACRKTIY